MFEGVDPFKFNVTKEHNLLRQPGPILVWYGIVEFNVPLNTV